MPVVNRRHASLDVIEDLANHETADTKVTSHSAGGGSPEIMRDEVNARCLFQARRGLNEIFKMITLVYRAGKDPDRIR